MKKFIQTINSPNEISEYVKLYAKDKLELHDLATDFLKKYGELSLKTSDDHTLEFPGSYLPDCPTELLLLATGAEAIVPIGAREIRKSDINGSIYLDNFGRFFIGWASPIEFYYISDNIEEALTYLMGDASIEIKLCIQEEDDEDFWGYNKIKIWKTNWNQSTKENTIEQTPLTMAYRELDMKIKDIIDDNLDIGFPKQW